MRTPSGGLWKSEASKHLPRSQEELGSAINLALQRLTRVVAAELGHMAESLHELKEENSRLREKLLLLGSEPEPTQPSCLPIAVPEIFGASLPCADKPLPIAKKPLSIKCLPPVKPAVEDRQISDVIRNQEESCSDQHAWFEEDGKDSEPHTRHSIKSMPFECELKVTKMNSARTKSFDLLPVFDTDRESRGSRVSKLMGVTQTDHSFKKALLMLENENSHKQSRIGLRIHLHPWIISPIAPLSIAIDVVAVTLILYDCVVVPLLLLQDEDSTHDSAITFMFWVARIFWTLAIPRTFITGYLKKDGRIETNIMSIARKYGKTWLIFDVAIVVTDWIDAKSVGVVRIIRLTKAARLARMSRVPNKLISQFNYANSERMLLWFTILKSMFTFVLVNHFLACVWFWIGTQNNYDGWVSKLGLEGATILNKYTYSVHWSTSQFEGSTEVMPKSSSERAFGAFVMLLAFIWSAWFVSNITSSMTRLQLLSGQKAKEVATLQRFLADSRISGQLALRVLTSANFLIAESEKNQSEADVKLLSILSQPLLNEIHYEMHSGHLMHHPFFWHYNVHEPIALQKLCHSAITTLKLGSRDVLFAQGEKPTDPHMFFVLSGTLLYIKDFDGDGNVDPDEMAKVTSPMWVCEPVLWIKWTHVGNLRAATYCSILALSAEVFRTIHSESVTTPYPAKYAVQLVARMNSSMRGDDAFGHVVDDLLTGVDVAALVRQVFPHYLVSTRKLFKMQRPSHIGTRSLDSSVFKGFR